MPPRFESYAKILHSIEASYKYIDHPLTEDENAILKIPKCKSLRPFVEKLRKEHRGPRIRWRELADLMGVPFQTEICHKWFRTIMEEPGCWPRYLIGPGEGYLTGEELSRMISILSAVAGKQECFFRFSEVTFIVTERPILFCGGLEELAKFLTDGKYQFTPEYWWPSDRSWCLCSDYDFEYTLIGGSKQLISSLLNEPTLEVLEITPQTRIDDLAPMPK